MCMLDKYNAGSCPNIWLCGKNSSWKNLNVQSTAEQVGLFFRRWLSSTSQWSFRLCFEIINFTILECIHGVINKNVTRT